MKAARLYGTGMLVAVDQYDLDRPFDPEQMREGDLVHFLVLDRFDASVKGDAYDVNKHSKTYGQPLKYYISPKYGEPFEVDISRIIRFDGLKPLTHMG